MLATRIEMLQRMPIFGAIRDETLQFLLQQMRSVALTAGAAFFHEGDDGASMFVLESGVAEVLKEWQGRALSLRQLQPGDCFGEMALMDYMPRSATVRARTDCQALELRAEVLLQLFEHDQEQFALIQMNMGREVCRRLRAADEELFRRQQGAAANPAVVPSAS